MLKAKLLPVVKTVYDHLWRIRALPMARKIVSMPSYYPERERKSGVSRLLDNMGWILRRGEVNEFYNLYGLDIKGSHPEQYLDYRRFFYERNADNRLDQLSSQCTLLRDKFLFYLYMSHFHMPVPRVFALCLNGKFYDTELKEIDENKIKTGGYYRCLYQRDGWRMRLVRQAY